MIETLTVDTGLGEMLHENEERIGHEIADAIAVQIRQGQRPALRDAHPKAHGCVHATFQVEDDLPPQLAQGVFVKGKSYPAWIRFSNGAQDATQPDAKGDGRGMAIKLLDVPGEKILSNEREAQTQDFIMINYPVFFADDPASYLALIHRTGSSNPLAKLGQLLALGLNGALIAHAITSSKIASPLETRYWSMVPYRLGDPPHKQAIKFSCATTVAGANGHSGQSDAQFLARNHDRTVGRWRRALRLRGAAADVAGHECRELDDRVEGGGCSLLQGGHDHNPAAAVCNARARSIRRDPLVHTVARIAAASPTGRNQSRPAGGLSNHLRAAPQSERNAALGARNA